MINPTSFDGATDIVTINVGGEIIQSTRATLCLATGSMFAKIFSDPLWPIKDEEGRIFLDYKPEHIRMIVDYLGVKRIEDPFDPTDLPRVSKDRGKDWVRLLNYFGLYEFFCPLEMVNTLKTTSMVARVLLSATKTISVRRMLGVELTSPTVQYAWLLKKPSKPNQKYAWKVTINKLTEGSRLLLGFANGGSSNVYGWTNDNTARNGGKSTWSRLTASDDWAGFAEGDCLYFQLLDRKLVMLSLSKKKLFISQRMAPVDNAAAGIFFCHWNFRNRRTSCADLSVENLNEDENRRVVYQTKATSAQHSCLRKPILGVEEQTERAGESSKRTSRKRQEDIVKTPIDFSGASDVVTINARGEIIQTTRATLCLATGSMFAKIFSDPLWQSKDEEGRIFLDHKPEHIRKIVDYLGLKRIEDPFDPKDPPRVSKDSEQDWVRLLNYFGLYEFFYPLEMVNAVEEISKVRVLLSATKIVAVGGPLGKGLASPTYRYGWLKTPNKPHQKYAWKVTINKLTEGSRLLMGFANYGFSNVYGWTSDNRARNGGHSTFSRLMASDHWAGFAEGDCLYFHLKDRKLTMLSPSKKKIFTSQRMALGDNEAAGFFFWHGNFRNLRTSSIDLSLGGLNGDEIRNFRTSSIDLSLEGLSEDEIQRVVYQTKATTTQHSCLQKPILGVDEQTERAGETSKMTRRQRQEDTMKTPIDFSGPSDVVTINVRGKIIQTTRATVCCATGSMFAKKFSDSRWQTKDEKGQIFLDHDPEHIIMIVNYLRMKLIEDPLDHTDPPCVSKDREKDWIRLLNHFGLYEFFYWLENISKVRLLLSAEKLITVPTYASEAWVKAKTTQSEYWWLKTQYLTDKEKFWKVTINKLTKGAHLFLGVALNYDISNVYGWFSNVYGWTSCNIARNGRHSTSARLRASDKWTGFAESDCLYFHLLDRKLVMLSLSQMMVFASWQMALGDDKTASIVFGHKNIRNGHESCADITVEDRIVLNEDEIKAVLSMIPSFEGETQKSLHILYSSHLADNEHPLP